MKNLALSLAIFFIASGLMAQESAVKDYLKDPNSTSYLKAVQYLTDLDTKEPDSMQAKMNLAYIANFETKRLLSIASENEAKLKQGERFTLGNLYLGMNNYAMAIKIYDGINKDFPKWSCPWRHKGEALFKSENYPAAIKALEKSIETNESHYDAYIWYAKALYADKQYKKALTALEKALTLNAEEEDSHFDEEIADSELQQLHKELKARAKKSKK